MYGEFYYGRVISIDDPEARGRVEVEIDEANSSITLWAQVLTLSAGNGYGVQMLPKVDERVLVAFPNGKGCEPVVLGALFTGETSLPETDTTTKTIKSKAGHKLSLVDNGSREGIELETASGHRISIGDDSDEIELAHSSGATVTISSDTIKIQSNSKIEIDGTTIEISASTINLDAATVNCSGIITGDTLQVNSVIASTYTPGTGNVW